MQISRDHRHLPGLAAMALASVLLLLTINSAGSVATASPPGIPASERQILQDSMTAPDAARLPGAPDAQAWGPAQLEIPAAIATPPAPDTRVYLPLVVVSYDSLAPVISSLSPVQGAVGEKVVIGGWGFGAGRGQASHVFLHDVPVPDDHILTWSDDQITIRIPVEATTGSVVVLVGDKNSHGAWFTVTSPFVEPQPEEIAVDGPTGETVVRDELLVGFWPGTPPEEIVSVLDTIGGDIIGHDLDTDRYQIKIPGADPAGIQAFMDDLAGNIYINYLTPHIVTGEPVGVVAEAEDTATADLTEVVADQFLLPADSSSRFMGETSAPLQSFLDEVIRLTNTIAKGVNSCNVVVRLSS